MKRIYINDAVLSFKVRNRQETFQPRFRSNDAVVAVNKIFKYFPYSPMFNYAYKLLLECSFGTK
jgi:hypothetical protein